VTDKRKKIGLGTALIPVAFLIVALSLTIGVFKQPPHIPLIGAAAVAAFIAVILKHPWKEIQEGMVHGITLAMGAILILMVVGTMIGTWIMGGVVPSMIYYGLKILSPGIFLVATLIICSIVSLGTGSSWSTAGTVGVALVGVGQGLGVPVAMVGGAIISGAYFGDKMSPLSDTTNLAPAVAIILYGLLGTRFSGGGLKAENIEVILSTIKSNFFIHPILLLPPLLVIVMVVKKIPPLPALLGGTAFAQSGFVSESGVKMVDDLLTRGGLESMMSTVALIICALSFGGIMEKTGMLEALARSLLKRVKRTGSLVATTIFSCIGLNAIASDQYMAIVIPGRMYKNAFDERGLHPKNLSRCLEDSGTLTSPLIPWNSCGAFMGATLGINPLLYLPYAFLNLSNPLVSLLYGYTGITMEKVDEPDKP
jgi:NhaC family Na+:H+ antiporter